MHHSPDEHISPGIVIEVVEVHDQREGNPERRCRPPSIQARGEKGMDAEKIKAVAMMKPANRPRNGQGTS